VDQALRYDELLPLVLEHLPTDRPFVVLGESFSGPLAIRIAAVRPPCLRALVLVVLPRRPDAFAVTE
jgi:pimeloyl-ACP methyl ester carboxylesterase